MKKSKPSAPWCLDKAKCALIGIRAIVLWFIMGTTLVTVVYHNSGPIIFGITFTVYIVVAVVIFALSVQELAVICLLPLHLGWLRHRQRRAWQKLTASMRDESRSVSEHLPYRVFPSMNPEEQIRWRIEHAPNCSDEIRELAAIEEQIASLEAERISRRS